MVVNRKYLLKKTRLKNEPKWEETFLKTVLKVEADEKCKKYKVIFKLLFECNFF